MKYIRIRLDYKYAKKGRFTRTLLVRDNPSLEDLGRYLVFALGGELEHMYFFKDNSVSYLPEEWREDEEGALSLEDSYLSDLSDNFTFVYDTGEDYVFECLKEKDKIDSIVDKPIIIEEAKGLGIYEDNAYTLNAYLNGEIEREDDIYLEENGYSMPWNHKINSLSDFDKPIDIDKLNRKTLKLIRKFTNKWFSQDI